MTSISKYSEIELSTLTAEQIEYLLSSGANVIALAYAIANKGFVIFGEDGGWATFIQVSDGEIGLEKNKKANYEIEKSLGINSELVGKTTTGSKNSSGHRFLEIVDMVTISESNESWKYLNQVG